MDKAQTASVLNLLQAIYPATYKGANKAEKEQAVEVWQSLFADDPVELVVQAVRALAVSKTDGFAPVPGAIKAEMYRLTHPNEMTEQEAWRLVLRALENSSYGREVESFNKLPPLIQQIVGDPQQLHEWGQMDYDELNTVVASNFMRSYREKAKHARHEEMLPSGIREIVEQIVADTKLSKWHKPVEGEERRKKIAEARKALGVPEEKPDLSRIEAAMKILEERTDIA